jgi:hypothetical protein
MWTKTPICAGIPRSRFDPMTVPAPCVVSRAPVATQGPAANSRRVGPTALTMPEPPSHSPLEKGVSVPPEILEPVRRQRRVDRRARDRAVAEPPLDRPRIVALVGKRVVPWYGMPPDARPDVFFKWMTISQEATFRPLDDLLSIRL